MIALLSELRADQSPMTRRHDYGQYPRDMLK